jgi:hypothetical protein
VDGSSRQTNRHGIPLRRVERSPSGVTSAPNPPKAKVNPCVWPGCLNSAALWANIFLCSKHAAIVHTEYALHFARTNPNPPKRAKRPPVEGLIYYIQIGSHIKIGWTSDLGKRSRAYPPNAQLLATQPGTRTEERALHRRFAHHRTHGREWYPLAKELLDHVRRVAAEHGPPPTVTFGAREVEIPQPRPKQYIKPRHWVGHRSGN